MIWSRTYHNALLHVLCCATLAAFLAFHQSMFAICDKKPAIDHDMVRVERVIQETFDGWKRRVFPIQRHYSPFLNLNAAAHFALFGTSLAVFKMNQAFTLLLLVLGLYAFIFAWTKRELFGLLGGLTFLGQTAIVDASRRQDPYMAVSVLCLVALAAAMRDPGLRSFWTAALFLATLAAEWFFHSSLTLYILMIAVAWFVLFWKSVRHGALLLAVAAMATMTRSFVSWLGNVTKGPVKIEVTRWDYLTQIDIRRSAVDLMDAGGVWLAAALALGAAAAVCKAAWNGFPRRLDPGLKLFALVFVCVAGMYWSRPGGLPSYAHVWHFTLLAAAVPLLYGAVLPQIFRRRLVAFLGTACLVAVWAAGLFTEQLRYEHDHDDEVPVRGIGSWRPILSSRRFSDDVLQVAPLIDALRRRASPDGRLNVLSMTVALTDGGGRAQADNPDPFYVEISDDARQLYVPQAFFADIPVAWKHLFLAPRQDERGGGGTFDVEWLNKGYEDLLASRDASEYPYFFLSVRSGLSEPRKIPPVAAVLDAVRRRDLRLFDLTLAGARPLVQARSYKNVFLYVLERRSPTGSK